MENEYALAPLLFVILALLVGAFLKLVLRKSRFPYTVGLFCVGLLVGIVYREGIFPDLSLAARAVDIVGNVNPDMILYIFLPVLIFSAAYEIDLHTFRKTLFNSTVLAVPGVIISMFLVAATMMAISSFVPEFSGWNWTFALMFGALVSATDPVAVVALLKELGTSKKFSTLVDAESLLNDGTGIVLFMLFFGAFSGSSPICSSPFAEFMVVALGGAVLGYLVAVLCIFLISKFRSDELVQNSVIILSAYVTFILAQAYLHLSGVIALVAFGLEMTYHGKIRFSPKANEFTEKFWDLAAFIANTLIFIIVGIIISVQVKITWVSLAVTVGIYLAVNLIRTAVIFLFYPLMKRVGYGLTVRDAIILSWGGLRGALGLSLAMMVSCTLSIPVDIRNQVLLMTAGVVTLTLTVNATTIRRLLARLGLTEIPVAQSFVDYNIRKRVSDSSQKYFDRLRSRESLSGADWEKVGGYLPKLEAVPDIASCSEDELLQNIRLRIYGTESQLVRQLYYDGAISAHTYRTLISSQERHFDSNGSLELSDRDYIFRLYEEGKFLRFVRRHSFTQRLFSRWIRRRVLRLNDLGRGFSSVQRDSLDEVAAMYDSVIPQQQKKIILSKLEREVRSNLDRMKKCLDALSQEYPQEYAMAQTNKASRMLLANERRTIRSLSNDGILSKKDADHLEEQIGHLSDSL